LHSCENRNETTLSENHLAENGKPSHSQSAQVVANQQKRFVTNWRHFGSVKPIANEGETLRTAQQYHRE
jgi:hypothetical protein